MNVLLASPRGFCAGVEMAIECLEEAIRCVGPEIYVYHEILESADILIVLGSQNRSNSRRLMEKGLAQGVSSYLVDAVGELQLEWFTNARTVVVTAGAR